MSSLPTNSIPPGIGVRLAGVGSAVPDKVLTNADLEKLMDTSDEWIVQRTGIRERRIHEPEKGLTASHYGAEAMKAAMADAGTSIDDIDLLVVATMTPEMPTPSVSSLVADKLGAGPIGAFDICAGCCGFVFSLNVAHDLVKTGRYKNVAVIGTDCLTKFADYSTYGRSTAILFGDAAGGVILQATNNPNQGLIAQAMHSDGGRAKHLYIPCAKPDFFDQKDYDQRKLGVVQMNGPAVFKFAVSTFPDLIEETLDKAGLKAEDVDHFVCHQSNARILSAARERFGLPEDKLLVNIDRYGNTVAASVPLVLDELKKGGRIEEGQKVMFLAFGAGLTWGSSLWQL
ncbi:MAG: beta-ketoacyl-ACP synthase III [Phycisphaerales bacterium]